MPARSRSSGRDALPRRDALRWLTAAGIGLLAGSAAHGALYERHWLGVTRVALPVPGLAPALDGLRVGVLTDTHHSLYTSQAFIADAARQLVAERPDVIVLGGDYVTQRDRRYMGGSAEALAGLRAPHGIFAVMGNHDDDLHMPRALARQGFTVLRDERTSLRLRGERLDLIGLRFWSRDVATLERLARGKSPSTLLLAHDPRRLAEAQTVGIPAVISGHTHGGQVSLPWVGPIAARKYPIPAGVLALPSTSLFVSRGLGTVVLPVRVDCTPEVAVVTLTAAPAPTKA